MIAQFTVNGIPKAKGRPKFSRAGNYVNTYTPKETLVYENLVKLEYERQCEDLYFGDMPLQAKITAYFPIPKNVSKKKHLEMSEGEVGHTKKPDCDNIAKIILDALNHIAFKDDSQICKLIVEKLYSDEPRVEVVIETYERRRRHK